MNITFVVNSDMRLDKALQEYFHRDSRFTNSKIRRAIFAHCVKVGGSCVVNPAALIKARERVTLSFNEDKFFTQKEAGDVCYTIDRHDILYEDDVIIAFNKIANYPLEPTIVSGRANLHDALVKYIWDRDKTRNAPYIGLVHRIDRTTSGAVLFAKMREVNKKLHEMFEERAIDKYYLAMVQDKNHNTKPQRKKGEFKGDVDTFCGWPCNFSPFLVEGYVARLSAKSQKCKWGVVSKDSAGALYAKTQFFPLDYNDIDTYYKEGKGIESDIALEDATLLGARLFTGRTHQIRVQLSSVGLPIVGDVLYGGAPYKRVMLHSYKMCFRHPITDENIEIIAPWK